MAVLSTDQRFPGPQSIRKLLSHIRTSPNLLDYWSYSMQTENASDAVENPRQLTDLHEKLISTYIGAFVAYAHLLSITSQSEHYLSEALRLLAFCLIPILPVIQVLHNSIDIVLLLLEKKPWTWSYLFAGLCGVVLYEEQTPNKRSFRAWLLEIDVINLKSAVPEPRDVKWWGRLCLIVANIAYLIFPINSYLTRLAYHFHGASFIAATGFDHRVGWIAFSAPVPTISTLNLHLCSRKWNLEPAADRNRKTANWTSRLTLGIAAATVITELTIKLTGRITVIHLFLDRLLKDTFEIILPLLLAFSSILISA